MHSIGGYFGLELHTGENEYHTSLYKMKSGRSALSFLLNHLTPHHVYLPFYTCNALLEPFTAHNIAFSFYAINKNFEIDILPSLKEGEMLVYINYYGIKDAYVEHLSGTYTNRLMVDCTQAYFTKANNRSWYFNSARKFFGVPDGADLYVPGGYNLEDAYNSLPVNQDYITDHLLARFNGNAQEGYPYFQQNELLNGGRAAKMSRLTERLLSHVQFRDVIAARKENFNYLHHRLQNTNQLQITPGPASVPFFYPYLPPQAIEKATLWPAGIFIPVFWSDCLQREEAAQFSTETGFSKNLLPLPIDHRYSRQHMDAMLEKIQAN